MTRRGSLSIRTKLGAAFGALVLLMAAIGGVAVAKLSTENAHVNELASRVVPATDLVGQASAAMNKYRKDQLHYILATPADRAGSQGVSGDLAGDLQTMAQLLRDYRAKGLISEATDAALLRRFQSAFYTYVSASSAFRTARRRQPDCGRRRGGRQRRRGQRLQRPQGRHRGLAGPQVKGRRDGRQRLALGLQLRPPADRAPARDRCGDRRRDRRAHAPRDRHQPAQARPRGHGDLPRECGSEDRRRQPRRARPAGARVRDDDRVPQGQRGHGAGHRRRGPVRRRDAVLRSGRAWARTRGHDGQPAGDRRRDQRGFGCREHLDRGDGPHLHRRRAAPSTRWPPPSARSPRAPSVRSRSSPRPARWPTRSPPPRGLEPRSPSPPPAPPSARASSPPVAPTR